MVSPALNSIDITTYAESMAAINNTPKTATQYNIGGVANEAISASAPSSGIDALKNQVKSSITRAESLNAFGQNDWRVRLHLAPNSTYFYNSSDPGIMQPLTETNGVIFPYTPKIAVVYNASYTPAEVAHTNYKIQQYNSSSVDSVMVSGVFTAQDVKEANYVMAVTHFFRSMTKMFYGQDMNPLNGTPPPVCFIKGFGSYQFDTLPLAISSFTYNLPDDVDYIKTTGAFSPGSTQPSLLNANTSVRRLQNKVSPGGYTMPVQYSRTPVSSGMGTSWVPTKIEMTINCIPIVSRNKIANEFSLTDYANGRLLQGSRIAGGGFW